MGTKSAGEQFAATMRLQAPEKCRDCLPFNQFTDDTSKAIDAGEISGIVSFEDLSELQLCGDPVIQSSPLRDSCLLTALMQAEIELNR